MSEPRAEEEKQRIRVELMSEIASNEQDPEQCNEETGRYNREIFYKIRDLEQLCSITECPLTPDQIMEFKLCRSLPTKRCMKPLGRVAKQQAKVAKVEQDLEQCNEETGWYNREYLYAVRDLQKLPRFKHPLKEELLELGIWPYCQARNENEPNNRTAPEVRAANSSKMPDELLKPLHKADHPWKLEKINDDSDDARKELLIRQVRALLNKITATTEESLTKEFLDYKVYQSPVLKEIVSMIVAKASDEPKFSELYLRMCLNQITECENTNDNRFRYALHYSLQKALDFDGEKGATIDQKRIRNRRFGCVKFIAQLFMCGLTPIRYADGILSNHDEESIEGVLRLIEMIGYRLQEGNESLGAAVAEGAAMAADLKQYFPFDSVFADLQKAKPFVSSRIRFKIENLEEQRANGWKPLKNLLIVKIRALLNKIRAISDGDTTTEKSLTKEFLDYELYQSPALKEIVSIIVDMAVKEPLLCERLARLSNCQRIAELQTTGHTWSAFGDALLSRIDELDKGAETDEKKQIDSTESLSKLRSRKFGSVMFIGHLVLSGFIPIETFVYVIRPLKFVGIDRYGEEPIECLIRLQLMVGPRLQGGCIEMWQETSRFLYTILTTLHETKPVVSDRLDYMIDELLEQRLPQWRPGKIGHVRALLNKFRLISDGDTTTEESLIKEFLDYKVYELPTIREIVSIIIGMAIDEPKLCKVLSKLCKYQAVDEFKANKEDWSIFRAKLLRTLGEGLGLGKYTETEPKKQIDSPESLNEMRRRKFGSVNFIGHLYLHCLVPEHVFKHWMITPFKSVTESTPKFDEVLVECVVRLLSQIGARLHECMPPAALLARQGEVTRSIGDEPVKHNRWETAVEVLLNPFNVTPFLWRTFPFEILFRDLPRVKLFVSSRIRFMIEDLIEQRANGWKPRKRPEPRGNDSSSIVREEPPRPVLRFITPGDF